MIDRWRQIDRDRETKREGELEPELEGKRGDKDRICVDRQIDAQIFRQIDRESESQRERKREGGNVVDASEICFLKWNGYNY